MEYTVCSVNSLIIVELQQRLKNGYLATLFCTLKAGHEEHFFQIKLEEGLRLTKPSASVETSHD